MTIGHQFLRYSLVGVVGFIIDASVLLALLAAHAGVLSARAFSYLIAASCTWLLHRRWTFQDRSNDRARQWAHFIAMGSFGGAVNYGVYAILVLYVRDAAPIYPAFAAGVGAICGLAINFLISKNVVFEATRAPPLRP